MSDPKDIPILQDLIRTGEDLHHDAESTRDADQDMEIDFISEEELSEINHSDPINNQSVSDRPPTNEVPLYEAIKNEAYAKLDAESGTTEEDPLPDELSFTPPDPETPSKIDPEIDSEIDPVTEKKEPEVYKNEFSNVRELLLDEEIHLILDKHMEQAYEEITQLIKKRTR